MLNILGGRVHDSERQIERRAWCPLCRRHTQQGRSGMTGGWYCLECRQRVEG